MTSQLTLFRNSIKLHYILFSDIFYFFCDPEFCYLNRPELFKIPLPINQLLIQTTI